MKTMKTLMLAAIAALSAGAAMAQEADYQNLVNGGLLGGPAQVAFPSVSTSTSQHSLVTMFGTAHRTNLSYVPAHDGSDGGGH
jgi:hypothetical protein